MITRPSPGRAPARLALAAFAALAGGSLALAQQPQERPCPLSFAQFALAVPHLDLDACPEALGGARTFCLAVPSDGALHVFAFAEQGEQCLLRVDSLDGDAFDVILK